MPLSYRFNAEEMAYVIDNSDATLVVVDAEQAPLVAEVRDRHPEGAGRGRLRRRRARPDSWRGTTSSRPSPTTTRRWQRRRRRRRGRCSTRRAPPASRRARCARRPTRRSSCALLGELGLLHGNEVHITTGPLYHSGPLAFALLSHTLGCTDRRAAASSTRCAWLRLVKEHAGHQHLLGADPAEADRVAPARRARDAPTCPRCAA